jgi:hypothetical protein
MIDEQPQSCFKDIVPMAVFLMGKGLDLNGMVGGVIHHERKDIGELPETIDFPDFLVKIGQVPFKSDRQIQNKPWFHDALPGPFPLH